MRADVAKELDRQRKWLIKVRDSRNMAQSQWAAALGVAKGYVSKTEALGFEKPPLVYIELMITLLSAEEKAEWLKLMNDYWKEILKIK